MHVRGREGAQRGAAFSVLLGGAAEIIHYRNSRIIKDQRSLTSIWRVLSTFELRLLVHRTFHKWQSKPSWESVKISISVYCKNANMYIFNNWYRYPTGPLLCCNSNNDKRNEDQGRLHYCKYLKGMDQTRKEGLRVKPCWKVQTRNPIYSNSYREIM